MPCEISSHTDEPRCAPADKRRVSQGLPSRFEVVGTHSAEEDCEVYALLEVHPQLELEPELRLQDGLTRDLRGLWRQGGSPA